MKNPLLNEVRRVTGWHTLIDHESFPLLLAAASSVVILGLFPGVDGLLAAYGERAQQSAAVYVAAEPIDISVSEIDMTDDTIAQEVTDAPDSEVDAATGLQPL